MAPADPTIRNVLPGLEAAEVEKMFRLHGENSRENAACEGLSVVAFDGKILHGSFDHFTDKTALQLESA